MRSFRRRDKDTEELKNIHKRMLDSDRLPEVFTVEQYLEWVTVNEIGKRTVFMGLKRSTMLIINKIKNNVYK